MAEMNDVLLDTNVIIEIFKGNKDTLDVVENIWLENVYVCSITVMELYYGALNNLELKKIKKYLNAL